MNNFIKGVLVGVGVGLLVAPMKGEELRKLASKRFGELRGYLPENEQINTYKDQVSTRVSNTAGTLKGYTQQAASTVKSAANNLKSTRSTRRNVDVSDTSGDITDDTLNNNHTL